MMLNNDVMALTNDGVYPGSIGQEGKPVQGSVFLKSWQHAEDQIWLVMAGRGTRVWVNGRPLHTGIRVLQDRDDVRVHDQLSVFFSTEQLAEVLPFQAGNSPASLEQLKTCECIHLVNQSVMCMRNSRLTESNKHHYFLI